MTVPARPEAGTRLDDLAKAITDEMFESPGIQRLVLTIDTPTPRDMGGWSRAAFEKHVLRVLEARSPAPVRASGEPDDSVALAAEAYALKVCDATGRKFGISELIELKAWFYAGARWRSTRPNADVDGPSSAAAAVPSPPAQPICTCRDNFGNPEPVDCPRHEIPSSPAQHAITCPQNELAQRGSHGIETNLWGDMRCNCSALPSPPVTDESKPSDPGRASVPEPIALPVVGDTEPQRELKAEKDEAYRQRNHVVAALANLFPSGVLRTNIPGWSDDWHGCVYIDLPTGQISYHFHDSQAPLFAHLPPYRGKWDGHGKEDVHDRLARLKVGDTEPPVQELDIEPIKARQESATKGPWVEGTDVCHFDAPEVSNNKWAIYVPLHGDAAFIAHARTDIPALVAEVERLRALLAASPVAEGAKPKPCNCGADVCIQQRSLLPGFACVRVAGLAALTGAAAVPTCDSCAHLTPFELAPELCTCPVVNIRIHRESAAVFGCNQHTASAALLAAAPVAEGAKQDQALEALEFAHGAILDAIGLDDGLDSSAGEKVLRMIRAALTANGRTPPPDMPAEDVAVEPLPIWTASIQPADASPRQQEGIEIWAVFCEDECYAAYSREHQAEVYASGFSKPTEVRHMIALPAPPAAPTASKT